LCPAYPHQNFSLFRPIAPPTRHLCDDKQADYI
jgi:hypothetical protein